MPEVNNSLLAIIPMCRCADQKFTIENVNFYKYSMCLCGKIGLLKRVVNILHLLRVWNCSQLIEHISPAKQEKHWSGMIKQLDPWASWLKNHLGFWFLPRNGDHFGFRKLHVLEIPSWKVWHLFMKRRKKKEKRRKNLLSSFCQLSTQFCRKTELRICYPET